MLISNMLVNHNVSHSAFAIVARFTIDIPTRTFFLFDFYLSNDALFSFTVGDFIAVQLAS